MCRIAGIISNRTKSEELYRKVKVMCTVLQHGGPDDEGIFSSQDGNVVLGHRRLSFIDLSKNGHQPMADLKKNAWITFNGEIYNYQELKEELRQLGSTFHSNSDTEVILQAYLHWDTFAFSKLRGMFAFVLHDLNRALTYLVRDTAGIKPLYYHIKDNELSFASEVKALKSAGITTEADPGWQVRFLAYGHIPEPYTTLKNVFSLAKGHFLCWDNHKSKFIIKTYCKSVDKNYISEITEAKEQIFKTLQTSINRQLISDAPIGVFLSGGVDSSLITLLANKHQETRLKTVSIHFDEKAYDESAYQKIIVDKIQGEKFNHLVKQEDFEECFSTIMSAMDMPTTDGINTWFISKYAHEDGLKAVLSGVGADELYGGYPSFNRIKYLKYLKKIHSSFFSATAPFTPDHFKKIEYLSNDHPLADYLFLRGLFAPSSIAAILNIDVSQVNKILFENVPVPIPKYDEEYAAWMETNLYMQNQLLRDTDVMSMSHGLEVRLPFLDEDFHDLTMRISPNIRFDKICPKKILIDTFADILPQNIWNRPKMGFTFPLQSWMQQSQMCDPELYKNDAAQSIIAGFRNNKVHWSKSFALYQLQTHE
jgi:asparagine synthase (glutamine-hydrolysing)